MDYIKIEKLVTFAHHGVLQEETQLGQKFEITALLYYPIVHASSHDNLYRAINYADVCQSIVGFMQNNTFKLIETCAEQLSAHLLRSYPQLKTIELTIKKPWAPVHLPLDNISVTITRKWTTAIISLGSNIGDRLSTLCHCIDSIEQHTDIRMKRIASFIDTAPVGNPNQNSFLNGAIEIETIMQPRKLLSYFKQLESIFGREHTEKWGPRTLDIDIIFYDSLVIALNNIQIPHPRFRERLFVLEPIAEIAPYFKDPETGETLINLLRILKNRQNK